MSFATLLKKEMLDLPKKKKTCCTRAALMGMLSFCPQLNDEIIEFSLGNEEVCLWFQKFIAQQTGAKVLVSSAFGSKRYRASVIGSEETKKVFDVFPLVGQMDLQCKEVLLWDSCCVSAFLRGVFLVCGTMVNPEKAYHLEFCAPDEDAAVELMALLFVLSIPTKIVERQNKMVVYLKESRYMEDLLSLMGTTNEALAVMEVKIEKELRNTVNRRVNCETANISKIVAASSLQMEAIQKIRDTIGLESLPPNLRGVAQARLQHPEGSLAELCEALEETIGRSGVNHRLKKILEIASEL